MRKLTIYIMIVIIIVIIWIESKFKSKPLAYRIFEQIPFVLVKWYDRKNVALYYIKPSGMDDIFW